MKMVSWQKSSFIKMGKKFNNIAIAVCITAAMTGACDRNTEPITPTDITGIYNCQESSPHSGLRTYLVEIDKVNETESTYIISNFHNKGENEFLFAEFIQDSLKIFNQAISELSVNGKGPVEADFRSIYLYYETDDGITVLDYYANYTR